MKRTFVFEAGQPCRLSSGKCMRHGPSDLGECSLVRGCSVGTFLGLVGIDCYSLGPKNFVSGNHIGSKSYNFFSAISFC